MLDFLYFTFSTHGSALLPQGITESFGAAIHALNASHLTDGVIHRSKRMLLDTLGVGLLGTRTDVFSKAVQYSQVAALSFTLCHFTPHSWFVLFFFLNPAACCSADVCIPGEEQRLGESTGGAAALLRRLCKRHSGKFDQRMQKEKQVLSG